MLLTKETAGTLATRTAGLVDFRATLEWDEAPPGPPSCLPSPAPFFRHDLGVDLDPAGTGMRVSGTIRAPTERGLGAGLELVMRAVGNAAALSGAVLEMRAFLECPPRAVPPGPLQELALYLWRNNFPARFAPSWEPAETGALPLGAGGEEEPLRDLLRESPFWKPS